MVPDVKGRNKQVCSKVTTSILTFTLMNFSTETAPSQGAKMNAFAQNLHLEFYAGKRSETIRSLVTHRTKSTFRQFGILH